MNNSLLGGNMTPEVMEQNMLMHKIFNLPEALDQNIMKSSNPLQTPQTIIKGPNTYEDKKFQSKLDYLVKAEHGLVGKKAIVPRLSLRSHFDTITGLKFCANSQMMVSASEDCMVKLWDVMHLLKSEEDF